MRHDCLRRPLGALAWACAIVAGGTAGAQPALAPHAELGSPTLRAFDLQNQSGQPIVAGQARTTRGAVFDLTRNGAIRPDHAQSFMVQHDECLDAVHLRFRDGSRVDRVALHDCTAPHLVTDGHAVRPVSGAANVVTRPGTAPPQPNFQ